MAKTLDRTLFNLVNHRTYSEEAGEAMSRAIARHLGKPIGELPLHWFGDETQPKHKPVLRAHPASFEGARAEDEFAQAVVALAGGEYEPCTDPEGHTAFEATCHLGGVDTVIEYVVWRYDDPAGVAARLPALIRKHRS